MKKFVYVAKDLNGKKIKGTFIAEDEQFVRESLAKRDLYVDSIKKLSNNAPSAFFTVSGKVGIKELTSFCKQFSILISSGVSIIDSLKVLREQGYSSLLRKTIDKVTDDLYAGLMLSESMKKYPKVFPHFFTSMVYVGETSGNLDKVLISVSDYYTRNEKNKRKLRSALAYPLVLLVMLVAVVGVMLYVVIPKFISSFQQMELELPGLTLALFNISNFLRDYWQYIILGIFAIVGIIFLFGRTEKGRLFFDKMKVTLPIFKRINMAMFTSQFVECLGLLLSSGLDIVSSLESMKNIIKNKHLKMQFDRVIIDVKKGIALSTAVELEMKLSNVVTQMIAVGEKTGSTDKLLLQTNDYFDQEVESALSLITTTIQPVLLSILGVFIAVMFIAIYTPILSMITQLQV